HRILDLRLPPPTTVHTPGDEAGKADDDNWSRTREKLRNQLRDGKLDERTVEIDVKERNFPAFEIISSSGIEEMDINIKDILPGFLGGQRTKKRKMKIDEALEYLVQEEEQKLVDMDQVTRVAVERV